MTIAEKLQTISENEQKVYDAGFNAGQAGGIEIEITSTITNAKQLRDIIFNNLDETHAYCAVLKKPKNGELVDNQVIFCYTMRTTQGENGYRWRNSTYAVIQMSDLYDVGVTIGDIYKVIDLGVVIW